MTAVIHSQQSFFLPKEIFICGVFWKFYPGNNSRLPVSLSKNDYMSWFGTNEEVAYYKPRLT